jgi:hypothetical protein
VGNHLKPYCGILVFRQSPNDPTAEQIASFSITTQAALTLFFNAAGAKPSPFLGEGLQSGSVPLLPAWEKGLGDKGGLLA